MGSAETVGDILRRSGLNKMALSTRSGISRSLLDGYLKGESRPSVAQLERLADAADLRVRVVLVPKPRPVSAEYVAVMRMAGQLAGTRSDLPSLRYPSDVWRRHRLPDAS